MKGNDLFSRAFHAAAGDYVYLLEREYPQKSLIKVVGDRYGLNRRQRHVLYRGFASTADSLRRRARLEDSVTGRTVHLDAYNVLITIMNHLLGNPLFICSDAILRDVGENRGRIRDGARFHRAMKLLCSWLEEHNPAEVRAVFDSPVSHSAEHAVMMDGMMRNIHMAGSTELAHSADHVIKKSPGGVIATSDSVIIDATDLPVIDIPRLVLESSFNTSFPDLSSP